MGWRSVDGARPTGPPTTPTGRPGCTGRPAWSSGEELQSEYLLPRDRAVAALRALLALAERLDPRGVFANAWLHRHVLGA
jgi:hypothetical protein